MPLETAMPSSTKGPGIYVRVKLLAGGGSPGTSALRALMLAWKSTDGDITPETEKRTVYGADEALLALGEGVPGHLAAIEAFKAFGSLQLDIVAMEAPTGATASGSYVISGTPTDTNYFEFKIKGKKIGPVPWAVGETTATMHTRIKEAIAGTRNLPVVPATGSATSVVDLDARTPGAWGNDITFSVKKLAGSGGAIVATGARLADGLGEVDPTNALGLVEVSEYAGILLVTSNADATDNLGTAGPEILMDHIVAHSEGGDALLQYGFVGHTGTIANVKAGAIGRNSTNMTYAYFQNAQSLPAEVAGWELGDALRWYSVRANYNRIWNRASGLVGSEDRAADKLRASEIEDLLSHGVTPYDFVGDTDEVQLIAPITTHSLDGTSPDDRCYYQSDVFGEYAFIRDLRAAIPREFPNCSITEDLPADADPLPPGVVERRDVEAFVYDRARTWVAKGVLDRLMVDETIANGTFAVEIDQDSKDQVNIFIPNDILKPLAKFSLVAEKRRRD